MPDEKPDIRAIFCEALDQKSPEEIAEYLDAACAGDADLRTQVEALLRSHREAGNFLVGPESKMGATLDQSITEKPGTQIGPYKLLQQIGEGGFGVVYMAEQSEPVKRRVALKIIKPGMDTRQVIARFEAERQALAMMDHPNIAKVLDAGTTESGRPYFVMELVKGIPITKYCDQQHLTPKQRLDLFIPVCRAVQHAHHKGIIHRDLKPSNVLIALYDDRPVPKVIDFGVAKATSQKLTEKTMFTHYGQVIGTLEYMSPEQANLNQLDIDTRSDVYSLGVLLYELLTGDTPFDRQRLRTAAFDEMMRIIREEEPPRPSLRLSTSESLPSIAANRQIEPKKLSSLVRGELDWIVMKSLEKDRARRYETANGFANDIERYLNNEAVVACPPSVGYRFRKFARRNKATLAIVSVAALVLVAVAIGAGVTAARFRDLAAEKQAALTSAIAAEEAATQARDQEQAEREEAERQTKIASGALADAERQRERAEGNFALARSAVDEFLNQVTENELLTVPGLQPLRQELLSSAMEFYDNFTHDAENASELQVELAAAHHRIAVIRAELGQKEQSEVSNAKSIELFEQLQDTGNDSLEVRLGLAKAYFRSKRYDDTVALCQSILDTVSKHAETRSLLAGTYNSLALDEKNANDIAAALRYHQQALALREGLVQEFPDNPEYSAELGGTVNNLGVLLARQKKNREALAMFERGVGYSAEAYQKAPQTIRWGRWLGLGLRNVAGKQAAFGNQQMALQSYERLVTVRRKLAFENPAVPSLKGELYQAHLDLSNYQKELGDAATARRSLHAAEEVLENIPRNTPGQLFDLATVYGALATTDEGATEPTEAERDDQQRYADLAMETIVKAVEAGYRDPKALQSHKRLASLREREDFQRLVQELEKEVQAEQLAAKDADTDEQKLANRRQAVDVLRELIGTDSPEVRHRTTLAATLHSIGEIQIGLKQYDQAENSLQEALQIRKALRAKKPDDPQTAIDVLAVGISIGRLEWVTRDYSRAHERWQACLEDSLSLAQAHQDNQFLQEKIATEEGEIFTHYGRIGLWPLLRDLWKRNVQFRRGNLGTATGDFSKVLLALDDRELASRYFQQFAEIWPTENVEWFRVVSLACGLATIGDMPLLSRELEARARRVFEEQQPDNAWVAVAIAVIHYQRGEYGEAASILEKFRQRDWPQLAYLDAAVLMKLGERQMAENRWSVAERRYREICDNALSAAVADNDDGVFIGHWWQFAYGQVTRRFACEAMSGKPASADPWQHLIQARGYWLIGESEKAELELAAAARSAASDDPEMWQARARLFEQWGDAARAEAELQKIVDMAGDNPMPWIHRGRWYAERGEHEKADADFAKAAARDPNGLDNFLQAGWWVAGPYPADLAVSCPPEVDPDPSKPVRTIDPQSGLSDEPVDWQTDVAREASLVEFDKILGKEHVPAGSYYGLAYVYSPAERPVLMRAQFGGDGLRLWLNGIELHPPHTFPYVHTCRIPCVLRPGRNEILVKCRQRYQLYVGTEPRARALTLLAQGRWHELADIVQPQTPGPHADFNMELLTSVACAGDQKKYSALTDWLVDRAAANGSLQGFSVLPSPAFDENADRLVHLAQQYASSDRHDGVRIAALVHYRAGQYDQAQMYLDQRRFNQGKYSTQALRALVCCKSGDMASAQRWLTLAIKRFDDFSRASPDLLLDSERGELTWPHFLAEFCVLLSEAQREITGSDAEILAKFNSVERQQREYWENREPAVAVFDHNIYASIVDRELAYLARGRRLAELGRTEEAEADFSRAVTLVPDDYRPLLERAEFHMSLGRLAEAVDDFSAAFFLAQPPGRRLVEVAIQRRGQVLDELQNRAPDRTAWWRLRAERAAAQYDWEEAARCFTTSDSVYGHASSLAAISCVLGDPAGHEAAYLRLSELLEEQVKDEPTRCYWRAVVLGLRAQDAEKTAELIRLAAAAGEPTSRQYQFAAGLAHFRANKYEEAIDWLKKSPWIPESSDSMHGASKWAVLAMASFRLGRTEEARYWLKRCEWWIDWSHRQATAAADGDNSAGQHLGTDQWIMAYALTCEATGLIGGSEVITLCSHLVKHNPHNGELWRARATAYAELEQWDKAIADASEAIRLDPIDKWAYRIRANAHLALENYEEAIADLDEAIRLKPTTHVWTYILRGQAHLRLKAPDRAIVDLSEAIRLYPSGPLGYRFRGDAYRSLGRWDDAVDDYRRAVEIAPDWPGDWIRLIDAEIARGATDDQMQSLVNEAEMARGGLGYLMTAAWSLLSNRRSEYEKICHEAAARYAESVDPGELRRVAHAGALISDPVLDTKQLVSMIRRAVEAKPVPNYQHTMGLCLLRNQQIDVAIQWFNRSLEEKWEGAPSNWLGLAIAHAAAGRQGEATDWLRKAQERFERNPLDRTSEMSPAMCMTCQLLLQEAEQLLEPTSSVKDNDTKKTQ